MDGRPRLGAASALGVQARVHDQSGATQGVVVKTAEAGVRVGVEADLGGQRIAVKRQGEGEGPPV